MEVSLAVSVWMVSILVQAGKLSLIANTEGHDGQLCPEATTWTCTIDTNDSVVRWWLGNTTGGIEEIQQQDVYGLTTPMTQDLIQGKRITRNITGDPYQLYQMEYNELLCGTYYSERATYNITKLDLETPSIPEILSLDLTYDNDSNSLRTLTLNVARTVYKWQFCTYRKSATFHTKIEISDTNIQQERLTLLNSSHCNNISCTIQFTFNGTSSSKPLMVSVRANDSFNYSETLKHSVSYAFLFQVDDRNCHKVVQCSVVASMADGGTCNISYTGKHGRTELGTIPVNQDMPITVAGETNYTIQATITHGRDIIRLQRSVNMEKKPWQCAHLGVLLGVPGGAVLLLLLCICLVAVFLLCAIRRKISKFHKYHFRESPLLLKASQKDEDNIYSQLEQPASKYIAYDGVENYSIVQLDIPNYNMLQRSSTGLRFSMSQV